MHWTTTAACGAIAVKPVIDLGWNTSFGVVLGQDINPQTVVALAVLGAAALVLLTRGLPRTRLEQAALVLAGVALLSCLASASLRGVGDLLRLWCSLAAIFVAAVALTSSRHVRLFLQVFIAATTVPVVLALLQTFGVLPYQRLDWQGDDFVGRASGLYEHSLSLALFLLLAVPAALYLFDVGTGRTEKTVYAAFVVVALVVLVLTTIRAGLVAGAVVVLGSLFLSGRRRLILLSLAAVALITIPLWQRLTELVASGLAGSSFLRGRGDIWAAFVETWLDGGPVTWLVGDGYAFAESDVPLFTGLMYSTEPHSDFLRMLATYGVIGLVCYLAVIVALLVPALHLLRYGDARDVLVSRVVVLGTVAILLMSVTAEPFRYPSSVWVLLALGAYTASRDRAVRARSALPTGDGGSSTTEDSAAAPTAGREAG